MHHRTHTGRRFLSTLPRLQGILDNWFFVAVMVAQVIGQILIIEFGGQAFMVVPLSWADWGWCVLLGAGELVWNLVINMIPNMIPRSWRVRMTQPLKKGFWTKSKRRLVGAMRATRPFRKSMKTPQTYVETCPPSVLSAATR